MTDIVATGSTPATFELVEEIVREHEAAEGAATEAIRHAAACGRALLRAKEDLPHGKFIPFVEENLPFTRQTATGYMRIARAVLDGELQMEGGHSISGALKQLAAPKVEMASCPECGAKTSRDALRSREALRSEGRTEIRPNRCPACARLVPRKPKSYIVDSERKRQIAEKAEERFWATTTYITALEDVCGTKDAPLGEVLHLDRVVAVADHDQLREQLDALDQGIRRARQLRRELADWLEEAR